MAYTSRKRILRDQNVLDIFLGAQYSGVSVTRLSQVPDEILDDASDRFDLQGVPGMVQLLCELSADPEYDSQLCLRTLKEVLTKMTNYEARRNQEDSSVEEEQQKYAKLFIDYGGVEVLTRLIMFTAILPDESIYCREPQAQLRVKSVSLEILCRLISTDHGEELAASLTKYEDILSYMFTLLTYDKTFLTSCQFLEDMLQARRQVLNLNNVGNLKNLISYLDDQKLANFCRVLAVTISDLDIYENKSSLFAQNKQKRTKGFVNIRDINQELLLGIPDLLPRLINIACMKNYTPRYPGMVSELDCWMEWIENSMSDAAFDMPDDDDMEDFIGGISVAPTPGAPMVQQSGLKISNDLILRVQVVYVLGLFLVGKHRKKVQRKLAELQLVPGLSELFDQFIWKCQGHRNNSRHRLRGHNASCECSPEVALKIQFLRLVHSFCDHSDYKHLLLSRSELNEIKRINAKAGPLTIDGVDCINRQLMCKGSKGLLTKIVEVMKKEPTASTFRFWLARAVESYLRGSTSYCDQVFLLRRGLLQHIAGNIVDHEIRPKEILQSSFDLLGEMVKFNVEAFHAFDKVLNTKVKFEKFVATVNQNLVDSNMFIRSLILSLEHFRNVQPEHKEFCEKESGLLKHVGNFHQQMGYLRRLINLINVQNLTQENVSCLNTTLVFLMFANQKNAMPRYLRALAYDSPSSSDQCTNVAAPIMKNFRDLLMFWQDHYLHKDKDCSALEKSSRISFEYWKQSVNTLVSEDRNLENSIIHYMDPDTGRDS